MEIFFICLIIFITACVIFGQGDNSDESFNTKFKKSEELVNQDFQEELMKKIANPQYRLEILDLIKDDLQYVYGNDWKAMFDTPWYYRTTYNTAFDTIENIVLFLMLSKSGLVPKCYQLTGIKIGNYRYANTYECLKILHCVEKNVQQKRGCVGYEMIFSPRIEREGYGKHRGQEKPLYDKPALGLFYWSFDKFHYNLKFTVQNIHNTNLIKACKEESRGERSEREKNNPYKDKLVL